MKIKTLTTALFLSAAIFVSCKKDDDKNAKPAYVPEFSAKIDGKQWTAQAGAATNPTRNFAGLFSVAGADSSGVTVRIISNGNVIKGPGTYKNVVGQYQYDKNAMEADLYTSDFGGSAELTITKYDTIDDRISGTFSFEAPGYLISGEKKVTEGKFKDIPFK